jgi:flagella basal body P-ring formation protein FlgA
MKFLCSLFSTILLFALPVNTRAQTDVQQSHAEIHDVVVAFLHTQTRTLPGQVTLKVDEIDRRIVRSVCPNLEAFLPAGAPILGSSTVGIRCPVKNGWTLFVPVQITVSVDMLITSKPLPQGHVLQADDLSRQKGELTQLGILTDPAEAVGKVLKNGMGAGQILRQDILRPPYVVIQGDNVQLQVTSSGLSIHSEGSALGNAADGEAVQVKTSSGQVITGTARQGGIVEIRP